MGISNALLNETFKKFNSKYEGRKEDYFAPLFIAEKHSKSFDEVVSNCVFGNNDYGIDGYFVDKDAKNLYLYQFKWSENHELFKETYKRLIQDGIERLFGNPYQDSNLNPTIRKLKYELQEFQSLINKVYICFVFNGDPDKADQSKALESLREELESKKHFIDSYFESDEITLTIQYISNETRIINQSSRTKKTFIYDIYFEGKAGEKAVNDEQLFLGFLKLYDLHKMFLEMRQRLFEKNIRAGLSADKAPNRAIRKTLKDIVIDQTLSPDYFTFNHNGVTLFAEKIVFDTSEIKIIEPRILNGAQTITTFSRFIEDNDKNPALQKNKELLDSIKVVAKIISNAQPDFITNVTICNNRQNPVEPWNLRASDLIQFEFEDKFRNELGIFYERQEKSFENMTDEDLDDLGITEHKEINIRKLAQTFLALQGELDKLSRLTEVFETEASYTKTFKSDYLKSDARKIILLYKVHYRLNRIIQEIINKGWNKYYFASYARNLIWCLLIQAILNDDELEYLLDEFGNSLTVEANYNEYLKELSSKKIRFILSALIEDKKYQKFMAEEKYSFFRTKVVYQDAMQIAKKKYRWEKLNI